VNKKSLWKIFQLQFWNQELMNSKLDSLNLFWGLIIWTLSPHINTMPPHTQVVVNQWTSTCSVWERWHCKISIILGCHNSGHTSVWNLFFWIYCAWSARKYTHARTHQNIITICLRLLLLTKEWYITLCTYKVYIQLCSDLTCNRILFYH